MKILITGSNGQLGSELLRCFKNGKTELGVPQVLKQENEITAVDMDILDITDAKRVMDFVCEGKYDAIINCAAFTNVDLCEDEEELANSVNALGPKNLAEAAEAIGAKLVHISTDYVFSGNAQTPYREDDLTDPIGVYGKSKLSGEEYVKQFSSRYFIVRTSWLYGYVGKNFVKTIMNAARKFGKLRVVNDQHGNPTNCADLAHHILKLVNGCEYGIYHATGEGICSWYDFAKEILLKSGIECEITPCTSEEYPTKAVRPKYSALDNMMLKSTVGNEFRNWKDALLCFFENYREDN